MTVSNIVDLESYTVASIKIARNPSDVVTFVAMNAFRNFSALREPTAQQHIKSIKNTGRVTIDCEERCHVECADSRFNLGAHFASPQLKNPPEGQKGLETTLIREHT